MRKCILAFFIINGLGLFSVALAAKLYVRYCDSSKAAQLIEIVSAETKEINTNEKFISQFGAPLSHFVAAKQYMDEHTEVCSATPQKTRLQQLKLKQLPYQTESLELTPLTEVEKNFLQAENVGLWSNQWNMHNHIGVGVAAEGAWAQLRFTGLNTTYVAVIDSGITSLLPKDLVGRLETSQPYYFYVNDEGQVTVAPSVTDTDPNGIFHGTLVAGIIAAQGPTVTGVAGDVDEIIVLPIKVFDDDGGAQIVATAMAIEWAAGIYDGDMLNIGQLAPNQTPAKVINLSLGKSRFDSDGVATMSEEMWKNIFLPLYCSMFTTSINKVTALGVSVVIAAGNDGVPVWNTIPAGCPNINAIVVEATNDNGNRTGYSNYAVTDWMLQSMVLSAPGGEDTESSKVKGILAAGLCTVSGNIETCSYRYLQGTSFSAPHVAGIAAMIYGLKPDANLSYVKEKLSQSVWGNNIVNAQEAVRQTVVAEQSNNAEAGGGGGTNGAGAAIGAGAAALAAALALILYL